MIVFREKVNLVNFDATHVFRVLMAVNSGIRGNRNL